MGDHPQYKTVMTLIAFGTIENKYQQIEKYLQLHPFETVSRLQVTGKL